MPSCSPQTPGLHPLRLRVKVLVAQSCLTLSDPVDCSLPGSSAHGILQARTLEGVVTPFFRGWNPGLPRCRRILYQLSHQEGPQGCQGARGTNRLGPDVVVWGKHLDPKCGVDLGGRPGVRQSLCLPGGAALGLRPPLFLPHTLSRASPGDGGKIAASRSDRILTALSRSAGPRCQWGSSPRAGGRPRAKTQTYWA